MKLIQVLFIFFFLKFELNISRIFFFLIKLISYLGNYITMHCQRVNYCVTVIDRNVHCCTHLHVLRDPAETEIIKLSQYILLIYFLPPYLPFELGMVLIKCKSPVVGASSRFWIFLFMTIHCGFPLVNAMMIFPFLSKKAI